jgi:hypothetical protein
LLSIAPSADLGPRPPDDKVIHGCLMGCAWQLIFGILGFVLAASFQGNLLAGFLFVSWGVTQWIAIGPLIWRERSQGYPNRVKGLIITGCLGVLLSSACGAMFLR